MKHSATSLETWKNCPRLYKAKYIDRILPYVPHPAAERGTAIHDKLEQAVKTGDTSLVPEGVTVPTKLVQSLHRMGAKVELSLGVTYAMEPCAYNDPDVWLRGKIDVLAVEARPEGTGTDRVLVLDWKTGKVRPKLIQADMYRTLVGAALPFGTEINFQFYYVDHGRAVAAHDKDGMAWDRTRRLAYKVEEDTEYLPHPSWLCRFCEFHACRYNEAKA